MKLVSLNDEISEISEISDTKLVISDTKLVINKFSGTKFTNFD